MVAYIFNFFFVVTIVVSHGLFSGNLTESSCKYIKPPELVQKAKEKQKTLILAGGCSVPWRSEFQHLLEGVPLILLDPIGNPEERPYWEHHYINDADILLIWFPEVGECRGSLVELGRFLEMKEKQLFVGVHPSSKLFEEVMLQTKLRPEIKVATSLSELVSQVLMKDGSYAHKV